MIAATIRWRRRYLSSALFIAALLLPIFTDDPYWLTVLATAMAFSILALSLDLLWGYSGVLNLAPAMSFGLGAYAWGIVGTSLDGLPGTYLALLSAIAVPAAVGALVAFVSFSAGTRDIFFALITLSLTLLLQQAAQSSTWLTGGSNGLLGIPWPKLGILGFEKTFNDVVSFYVLTVVATAASFALCLWVVSGSIGNILQAIRENHQRVETLGYSTLYYRVGVSALSAAIGGLAGALYAPLTGIVDPSLFGVGLSIQPFVWVAVGGQGTLFGPLLAAVLISTGQQTLAGSFASVYLLSIGAIFVLVVLFLPGGLASIGPELLKLLHRLRSQPRPAVAIEQGHPPRERHK